MTGEGGVNDFSRRGLAIGWEPGLGGRSVQLTSGEYEDPACANRGTPHQSPLRRSYSVMEIVRVLTQPPGHEFATSHCNELNGRLVKEGRESVTPCHRLKFSIVTNSTPSSLPLHGSAGVGMN